MKVCQNCGHENSDKGKFCEECGAKLVEAPKFCPECGTKLEGTPKFCPECGSNLAEDTEVSDDDEHEDDSLDSDDDDNESDDYDEEYTEEDEDSADYEEYVDDDEHEDDEIIDASLREFIVNTITNEITDENFRELIDEAKTYENLRELIDDEMTKEKFRELMKEELQRKLIAEKKIEKKIREIVDKYLPIINKDGTYYRYAAVQNPEYAQLFQNVRSIFAKNTKQANLLGFIDTTIIGKGKNGLLFTNSAIYFKQAGFKGVYIPYSKISSMSIKGSFLNFPGTAGNGFFNTDISIIDVINLPALKDCLEEITAII